MSTLFEPLALGAITVPNRVIMAPLTRSRSTRENVPTAMMVDYYAMRASAGLITSEAIAISPQGAGFTYTPGLWRNDQIEAWRSITQAVNARGGRIIAQLAHNGRAGHSE
ncbi:oxidoreductase, partial [Bradyrhizobium ottawaense]